jgi:SWI/SNF-related matrix-associated actin-dependent regulator 1 of chromatin subfamily A
MEADDLYEIEDGELVWSQSKMTQILRLRQILVTPYLLGENDQGAALSALTYHAQVEFDAGNPIIVYTSFVQAFPHIRRALEEADADADAVWSISGGMTAKRLSDTIAEFQAAPTRRKALVCSIKGATSFTATEASVAFFVGFEWVPGENEQAEDRMHRIGQKNHVRCYYFIHPGTIEEHMVKILNEKVMWSSTAFGVQK